MDRTQTGPRPVPTPAAGPQEHSPCCAQCPGNPHRSPRAPGPLPAAQLCVRPSRGSPVKGRAVTAAVTAAPLPQSPLPMVPIHPVHPRRTGEDGDWGTTAQQQHSVCWEEIRKRCRTARLLLGVWQIRAVSSEMYTRHDGLPAQPAGSATPQGTERTRVGEQQNRRTLEMKIPSCEAFPPRMLKPSCERNQR